MKFLEQGQEVPAFIIIGKKAYRDLLAEEDLVNEFGFIDTKYYHIGGMSTIKISDMYGEYTVSMDRVMYNDIVIDDILLGD